MIVISQYMYLKKNQACQLTYYYVSTFNLEMKDPIKLLEYPNKPDKFWNASFEPNIL